MEKLFDLDENLMIRRVLRQDLNEIENLYKKLGADAVWTENNALLQVLESGELWACVLGKKIITCGGICTPNTKLALIDKLKEQDLDITANILLLPFAGDNYALKYLLDFLSCRIAAKYKGANYALIIPVKTGSEYAVTALQNDMVLVAMRPLSHLRINYIFFSKAHVQTIESDSITINMQDSLALSRYLESGYCGTFEENKTIQLFKKA